MYIILSIFLTIILGSVSLMMGPVAGSLLAFGIIAGILLEGLFLLKEIHKRLTKDEPDYDPVKEAYENYLKEKESKVQG
ncbi:hypothetical protein FZC76_14245 [Sutcliffiella horikoshii]|uniref:Uncharacterized protein n=1 Tax=Sutcliffiella horikoshii TaxID=79883 RepID=A0A5D4SZR9_9BACI|nr:hypothetical protein [Sutcliffiella horikoshii]TYS67722.1 hypothetical protein FZC76_14245 [Sutcliffiella horikoshii]